ncbi:MAG: hypothetical protein ABIK37_01425 [candidate division WOR-3 bacterium]
MPDTLAMHFLILKVLSAVGMGLVLKQVERQGLARLPVIRVNYAVAALIAFVAALAAGQDHISGRTALLAAVTGALFVAGLLVWMKAIGQAGLALSVVAMRTAIVIPLFASVIIWRERPTALEIAGAAAAIVALGLVLADVAAVSRAEPGRGASAVLWLALLFAVDGLVMVPAKIFQENLPQNENLPFQALLFMTAFAVTTLLYYLGRERVDRETLQPGALLGVANLGNYLFLVLALAVLPGAVVYPVIAAGEVALLALAGRLVWRERVGLKAWLGIALAVGALVLVQLGRAGGPG